MHNHLSGERKLKSEQTISTVLKVWTFLEEEEQKKQLHALFNSFKNQLHFFAWIAI